MSVSVCARACPFRVQCGLVGPWSVDVWNDGGPVAFRHCGELRQPGSEHRRLPLPRWPTTLLHTAVVYVKKNTHALIKACHTCFNTIPVYPCSWYMMGCITIGVCNRTCSTWVHVLGHFHLHPTHPPPPLFLSPAAVILEKQIRIPRSLSVKAASVLKGFLNKVSREQAVPRSSWRSIPIC